MGRFITADPTIQHPYDPQDFNRYAYARNNPVKYIDPTGLGWWGDFWNWLFGSDSGGLGQIIAAVVIMVVTLCAAVATGGAAAANPLFWAFAGEMAGAAYGGITAAMSGTNIGEGMLFGTIAGGASGLITGGLGSAGFGEFVAGEMLMGAVSGAGAGATSAYASGQQDIESIIKASAIGAGVAAIITGAMGILQGHPLLPSAEKASSGATPPKTPNADDASKSSPGTSGMSKPKEPIVKTKQNLVVPPKPKPTPSTHKNVLVSYLETHYYGATFGEVIDYGTVRSHEIYGFVSMSAEEAGRTATEGTVESYYLGLVWARKTWWKVTYK